MPVLELPLGQRDSHLSDVRGLHKRDAVLAAAGRGWRLCLSSAEVSLFGEVDCGKMVGIGLPLSVVLPGDGRGTNVEYVQLGFVDHSLQPLQEWSTEWCSRLHARVELAREGYELFARGGPGVINPYRKLCPGTATAGWRGRGFGCNHKPTPGISACKPFCRLGPPLCSKWLALTCRDVPGNVYFPMASKWRAQAILPDAIKMGVGAACDENSRDSGHYTINGIGVVGELDSHPGIRTCPMPSQAILPDAIKELAFWLAPT
ncbi:hypothetical protein DFH07DRAFT_947843 [Mycena maculata]|uniref:Uncharacterized protein n=1 Tax=Mycena maculata TaxID=230809 RepID=A0AAD7H6L0_9AGAR|nr:hypothetical protein DFH07DRAFT_947843 [Mycena maculata]